MTVGWRVRLVAGSGLLVLVSGFLPWWEIGSRPGLHNEGPYKVDHYGSAWRMSSRWTEAVLITVAAAAVWLMWRLVRGRVPWVVRLVALAAVALALFLIVNQRLDVRAWPPSGVKTITKSTIVIWSGRTPPPDPVVESWMKRDHLRSYHSPGLNVGVSWGFWVGLAGMVLVGASLIAAGPGRTRSLATIPSPSTHTPGSGPAPG